VVGGLNREAGGAPVRYSDGSIQTLLVLKQVFHLPYRAWEGIGRLLMRLMGLWICQLRITRSCGV
jgi:hypothetical protein